MDCFVASAPRNDGMDAWDGTLDKKLLSPAYLRINLKWPFKAQLKTIKRKVPSHDGV